MGELLYAYDASTSSSANDIENDDASVLFYFAVGREEQETFLMAQTRSREASLVFDIAFSGNVGNQKLLFVDDDDDVKHWRTSPDGCVGKSCSSWRLSFEWDGKDDLGDGFVFGPLPSHGYCVSIRVAEVVGDVVVASFVPDGASDSPRALTVRKIDPAELTRRSGYQICANLCSEESVKCDAGKGEGGYGGNDGSENPFAGLPKENNATRISTELPKETSTRAKVATDGSKESHLARRWPESPGSSSVARSSCASSFSQPSS